MIKTIFFDYAGVITPTRDNLDFAKKYCKRFGLTEKELMEITYTNFGEAAVGKIPDERFWGDIAQKLHIDPEEIKKLLIGTFPIDPRMIKLIDKIKGRYIIVMVSNQLESWLEKVIYDNNLRSKFHFFVNSYQIGVRKPDKEIFLAALKKSNSKPDETLFIDDASKNIIAAQELGINGIQFDTYEQFISDFKKIIFKKHSSKKI